MVHQKACCAEKYYIDNQRVLLYKVINWWYDCLPEESTQLCGSRIKYENRGNARILYDASEKELTLGVDGGFADLLAFFSQCRGCRGPSHFQCTWLNRKYFGQGRAKKFGRQRTFTVEIADENQLRILRSMQHHLVFVVEGIIGGLMNGQIALHQGGDQLKTCPEPEQSDEPYSIRLTLFNSKTNEVLATYQTVHMQQGATIPSFVFPCRNTRRPGQQGRSSDPTRSR